MRSVGVRFLPASLVGIDVLEFAINTKGRRAHPNYPAEFRRLHRHHPATVPDDYVAYNAESGGFGATGQNLVYVADLAAPAPADGASSDILWRT